MQDSFTPLQVVEELDKYIIGQREAKKNVAIALRNRWRRANAPSEIREDIVPNNILLIGSTGVGKTEIARRVAKITDAPFIKVEASKFTEVGYVGRDVESMIRDLVEQAVNMVRTQKKNEIREKAVQAAADIILDILLPAVKNPSDEQELNQDTRESFRQKLKDGLLDDRKIEIDVNQQGGMPVGVMGGPIDEVSMMNLQEMLGSMLPHKRKKRKVTIGEAKKILEDEEASKLIDMDEVKGQAIYNAQNLGIIFIDEIDKIASSSNKSGSDVSREGVQRDLLPIVEGSVVNTKYGSVKTDHLLFIAAGAFHVSKPSDLIPELQGRFPIRVELEALTEDNFYQILKTPKNALTKQYVSLLQAEGVALSFSDGSLRALAHIAYRANTEMENIGARRLQTVMSLVLNEILFEVPDKIPRGSKIEISQEMVETKLGEFLKDPNLSQYIL